jgi:hypothetical protein
MMLAVDLDHGGAGTLDRLRDLYRHQEFWGVADAGQELALLQPAPQQGLDLGRSLVVQHIDV